jgi:flavin reductase (DIM6/NTAB) family NADH-FMN oxidoreductase RutF
MALPPPEPGALSRQALRRTFGAFPTGVTLVAALVDGRPIGLLASSFTSVSLDPPLVSINVARTSATWPLLRRAPRWGITVLGDRQHSHVERLSRRSAERFDGVEWTADGGGAVVLSEASATFLVSLDGEVDAGDHVLALLRVHDLHRDPDRTPLVFYGSRLYRIAG